MWITGLVMWLVQAKTLVANGNTLTPIIPVVSIFRYP